LKLFLKRVVTRRRGWTLIGALVLLAGVLWGVSSPTVSYIGPPGDPTTHLSMTIAKNGDVYIYPTNKSIFFIARHDDFSSPINIPSTDILVHFVARPDTISVNDTIERNLHVTQAHVIKMLELDKLDKTLLATYTTSDYNPSSDGYYESRWWPGSITLMAVGLLIACVALFVRRKTSAGGQKENDKQSNSNQSDGSQSDHHPSKDFFISYTHVDQQWAEWITWQLEEAGYTTILQAWDFHAGDNFVRNMDRATKQAERTIAVVSPDYFASNFTHSEWGAAFRRDPKGEQGLLVPVRVRPCDVEGLLGPIVYIDLVDQNEQVAQVTLLAKVKRERYKPTKAPAFPPAAAHTRPTFPGALPRSLRL